MNSCIFSDFDGTITSQDGLDNIICKLYSYDVYKKYENMLLENTISYEKYLYDLFDGKNILKDIDKNIIDPTFKLFYQKIGHPFYIISSGFKSFILEHIPYVNPNIIFANDISKDGNIRLYNGNKSIDKRDIILKYKSQNPTMKTIYIGDGLSDFSVLDVVDFIFVKEHSILHRKLIDMGFPRYQSFSSFSEINI